MLPRQWAALPALPVHLPDYHAWAPDSKNAQNNQNQREHFS